MRRKELKWAQMGLNVLNLNKIFTSDAYQCRHDICYDFQKGIINIENNDEISCCGTFW